MGSQGQPSEATQNAVAAYLWALEQGLAAKLIWQNAEKLACLAFEAQFQFELRLMNAMIATPSIAQ
jgi:hypothetical protein